MLEHEHTDGTSPVAISNTRLPISGKNTMWAAVPSEAASQGIVSLLRRSFRVYLPRTPYKEGKNYETESTVTKRHAAIFLVTIVANKA